MQRQLFLSCLLATLATGILGESHIHAVPSNPLGWEEVHPDLESTHRLFLRGDPAHGNVHVVDQDGHIMERDAATRLHKRRELSSYAENATVVHHQLHCHGQDDQDWCPDALPEEVDIMSRSGQTTHMTGTYRLLVLLVRFSDHASRKLPTREDVKTLFETSNNPSITPTGSVREFFKSQSFENLNVVAKVRDWVTLPGTEDDYSHGRHGMTSVFGAETTHDVLEQMENENYDWSLHDRNGDGKLDGVLILHSGFAAEASGRPDCLTGQVWGPHRIWSHQTTAGGPDVWKSKDGNYKIGRYATSSAIFGDCGSRCARVGVVGHEITHLFGIPDMIGTKGFGVGFYDIMGNSWGPDGSQLYPGTFSPYVREKLGWLKAERLTKNGVYELRASQDYPEAYRIEEGFPDGEFLYVENRQKKKFDSAMNAQEGGILVWHVSIPTEGNGNKWQSEPGWPGQPGWPANGKHLQIALLSPDGEFHLEKTANLGDQFDFWKDGMILGPGSARPVAIPSEKWMHPNTDSYLRGNIRRSGVSLSEFSSSDNTMSFRLTVDGSEVRALEKISFGSGDSVIEGHFPADESRIFGNVIDYQSIGDIRGTAADAVYNSHVWSFSDFGYVLDLEPNRFYDVTLGFAESAHDKCIRGHRVFSMQVGSKRANNLDVTRQAGCRTVHKVQFTEVSPNPGGDLLVMLFANGEEGSFPFLSTLEVIESPQWARKEVSAPPTSTRDVPIEKVHFGSNKSVDGYGPSVQADFLGSARFWNPKVDIQGSSANRAYAGHVFSASSLFYVLRLESGKRYDVKMGFAESYRGNCGTGKRVFSASVGSKTLSDIDVFNAVGCFTAYDVWFKDVRAHGNGDLLVVLAQQKENPFMSTLDVSLSPKPFLKLHFGSRKPAGEYGVPEPSRMIGYSAKRFPGNGGEILGTADPWAYAGHVWSKEFVGYRLSLDPTKRYDIVLGFSESFEPNCRVGHRVFSAVVGDVTMSDIDVFAAVGCKMPYDVKFSDISPKVNGELIVKVEKGRIENPFLSVLEVSESR